MPIPANGPIAWKQLRVLVVDDDHDNADTLARLLQRLGHEVATAHDGVQALAAAEGFRPEAIVLDVSLPDWDGLELARRIRSAPWGRNVLLIAYTGWGHPDARHRSHEAGFDHHLVKPVDLAELAKLLVTSAS